MTPSKTTAVPDTAALEIELLAQYDRWQALPEEIDYAIVALNRGGWSQALIAEQVNVVEQEISRRVIRCRDCDPSWVDTEPEYLVELFREFRQLPDDIDATMTALVDAGYSYGDVGRLIGATKQAIGPRVKRHRERLVDDG